eukprot:TRINITY_DN2425_c0_g1_i1.p2 TRINITY_DN2425_c0_g1~~TRINITY_DN2425_c0_g1_i1.p2  ORF type:complete len:390 (-),score=105.63 TRINITY_DN2425_c0_g1_i1:1370-2539(-)
MLSRVLRLRPISGFPRSSPSSSSFLFFRRHLSDYYETLGISRNASGKDIKQAYYAKAKEYHPDVAGDDPKAAEAFKAISEAYEVLNDPQTRSNYDGSSSSFGQEAHSQQQRGFSSPWEFRSEVDPEDLFRRVFGEFSRNYGGRSEGIFEDFSPFGLGSHAFEVTVSIPFIDAVKGVTKSVDIVQATKTFPRGPPRLTKRTIDLSIPPGIQDGQTLRVSIGGAKEVFVVVRVEASSDFRRSNNYDVHSNASISIGQAILGGVLRVKGLYEDLNVRIPPCTNSDSTLRLEERGIRKLNSSGGYGTHFVHLNIQVPENLSKEQKELIYRFAALDKSNNLPGSVNGLEEFLSRSSTSEESISEEKEEKSFPKESEEKEGFFSNIKKKLFAQFS